MDNIQQDLCTCGRPLDGRPHCVRCGSRTVYAAKKLTRTKNTFATTGMPDLRIMGFVCRSCGQEFWEDTPCAAQPARRGQLSKTQSELTRDVMAMPKVKRDKKMAMAQAALAKLIEQRIHDIENGENNEPSYHTEYVEEPHHCPFCNAKGEQVETMIPGSLTAAYVWMCTRCRKEFR